MGQILKGRLFVLIEGNLVNMQTENDSFKDNYTFDGKQTI